jgi:hypothetical protein
MQKERDALQADRDAQLAKCEDLEKRHYEETTRMRRKAKGFCDAIAEIDNLLTGKSLPLPSALADYSNLLLASYIFLLAAEAWPASEEAANAAVA